MEPKLRILLADDHPIVRTGLRSLIDVQPDMKVVVDVADGMAACRAVESAPPDIAVLDLSMPVLSGAEACRRIKLNSPEVRVLALTVHEDRSYIQLLMQAGASGYLVKRSAAEELVHAIRAIARGGTYLDPNIAGRAMGQSKGGPVLPGSGPTQVLGEREEYVLRQIALGFSNKEIAARLDVSIKTVETDRARGLGKLGVTSRAGVVSHAIRTGWLSESES